MPAAREKIILAETFACEGGRGSAEIRPRVLLRVFDSGKVWARCAQRKVLEAKDLGDNQGDVAYCLADPKQYTVSFSQITMEALREAGGSPSEAARRVRRKLGQAYPECPFQ